MATSGGMNLTMDLTRYFSLPSDVRVRFDGWLKAEHLFDRHVVQLTLGEGTVTVERYATDGNGNCLCSDNNGFARVTETLAVMTLPPREAWDEYRWTPEATQ